MIKYIISRMLVLALLTWLVIVGLLCGGLYLENQFDIGNIDESYYTNISIIMIAIGVIYGLFLLFYIVKIGINASKIFYINKR